MDISWNELKKDSVLKQLSSTEKDVFNLIEKSDIFIEDYNVLKNQNRLEKIFHRISSSFTIIVIGQVSSGKSSFINSLLGRRLFPSASQPTDGVISILLPSNGREPEYAEKINNDGTINRFTDIDHAFQFIQQQNTNSQEQLACREVRFYLDEPWLYNIRVVNTPGLGDRLQEFEKSTLEYLSEDESDLVIWTFFPETASNSDEIGIFEEALAQRKNSVIGIVTRCLESKEDDDDYLPTEDDTFTGKNGVVSWLNAHLGEYLSDIVLYDSHQVRRLVEKLRRDPGKISDQFFYRKLCRAGHTDFNNIFNKLVGKDREKIEDARTQSILKKCIGHAEKLKSILEEFESKFESNKHEIEEHLEAWEIIEKEFIRPSRIELKDSVTALAEERSEELITLMGNSASDTIRTNFKLLETLARSLLKWTPWCNSPGDTLNQKIEDAIKERIKSDRFDERFSEAYTILVEDHLVKLNMQLTERGQYFFENKIKKTKIGTHQPVGDAGGILGDAVVEAMKGVMSALLKSLSQKLEQQALEKAAQQAATASGKAAAKEVGKKSVGSTAARIASVITLVLIPFDINKLIKDFSKGRENLAEYVKTRYRSERITYEIQLKDLIWPLASNTLNEVLKIARGELTTLHREKNQIFSNIQNTKEFRKILNEISDQLWDKLDGRN